MPERFAYGFRVRLHDTDAAGRLFFAHLFRHAHDAYEAFLASFGVPLEGLIAGGETLLPLTHAEADYRRAILHGDRIDVEVVVEELRQRSFSIGYRFTNERQETVATARTLHVAIGTDPASAPELPPRLRAALRDHLALDPEGR